MSTTNNPAASGGPAVGRIVVGLDGSEGSREAFAWAVEEGRLRSQPVAAVLAWSLLDQHHRHGDDEFDPHYGDDEARTVLAEVVDEVVGGDPGVEIELVAVCDLPAPALLSVVGPDDLLVVGARGKGGFAGLHLGSVSQHCVTHAPCPVVVVRHHRHGADAEHS